MNIKCCVRKMYKQVYTYDLVTYKKYFVNRNIRAHDGSLYKKPQHFIAFYVNDDSISRLPFNIIFRQVGTGHLTWTHVYNTFYEIKLPFLKDIRNYTKVIPSLQTLCKYKISKKDIYLFRKYYC